MTLLCVKKIEKDVGIISIFTLVVFLLNDLHLQNIGHNACSEKLTFIL